MFGIFSGGKTGGFRTGFYIPEMADGKNLDTLFHYFKK